MRGAKPNPKPTATGMSRWRRRWQSRNRALPERPSIRPSNASSTEKNDGRNSEIGATLELANSLGKSETIHMPVINANGETGQQWRSRRSLLASVYQRVHAMLVDALSKYQLALSSCPGRVSIGFF